MKVKVMMMFFWIVLLIFVALQLYVRLAPSQPENWAIDTAQKAPGDYPSEGGFMAVRDVEGDGSTFLQAFDQAIRADPTTQLLGTVSDQKVYVSRSRLWGFPDHTTVRLEPVAGSDVTRATIYSRLRFGRSDMGVNERRLKRVLAAVGAGL